MDRSEFIRKLRENLLQLAKAERDAQAYAIGSDTTEEELIQMLSEIDSQAAGLDYFLELGHKLFHSDCWELLNVVKTYIEYNFDVQVITKDGETNYEICKKP